MVFGRDTDPNVGKNTQFKPGQSGNPNGPPKGYKPIATWIKELLNDENFDSLLQHPTQGYVRFHGAPIKAIVQVAIRKAQGGDKQWADWLAKYSGEDTQKVQLSNDPENPITDTVVNNPELRNKWTEFLKGQTKNE